MKDSRAWMIGIMVIMGIACSAALALVTRVTTPIIEANETLKYRGAILDVFGYDFPTGDAAAVDELFASNIQESETAGLTVLTDTASGSSALVLSGSGFQGQMSVLVAVDDVTITGFRVLSQAETPGLGARITEPAFQESFIGKNVRDGVSMTKSGSAGVSEFDAISGATETSRALGRILTEGFLSYFSLTDVGVQ